MSKTSKTDFRLYREIGKPKDFHILSSFSGSIDERGQIIIKLIWDDGLIENEQIFQTIPNTMKLIKKVLTVMKEG